MGYLDDTALRRLYIPKKQIIITKEPLDIHMRRDVCCHVQHIDSPDDVRGSRLRDRGGYILFISVRSLGFTPHYLQ